MTSAADYQAVNAALGRSVASVPKSKAMDSYHAWAEIVIAAVANKLFSTLDPLDAQAAAKAFYELKDVVKAAQQWEAKGRQEGSSPRQSVAPVELSMLGPA